MRRTPVPLLAALVTALVLLSGCSGGSDQQTAGEAAVPGAAEQDTSGGGQSGGGTEAGGDDAGAGGGTEPAAPSSVLDARVAPAGVMIHTADLTVRVARVPAAAEEAKRLATAAGGSVEAEERSGSGEHASAMVRLRVPPAQFDTALSQVAGLGEEVARQVRSTDVEDQLVDLQSRLATQRASVIRVRTLLEQADDLADVVQIEGELTRRTADLESLQARLAALEGQVAMSTIVVHLVGDEASVLAAGGPRGFRDGLEAGWEALVAVARGVGVTAGVLLPWSPLLLLVGALVWRARRRAAAPPRPVNA